MIRSELFRALARLSRATMLAPLLCLTATCRHSEPFTTDATSVSGAHDISPPVRLTYNVEAHRFAQWVGDTAIIYSARLPTIRDPDICLRVIPASGGTATAELCHRGPVHTGATDRFTTPIPAPDGSVLYVGAKTHVGGDSPFDIALIRAPLTDLGAGDTLTRLPTSSGRSPVTSFLTPHWLTPDRLAFVGADGNYRSDTTVSGHEVVIVDLS